MAIDNLYVTQVREEFEIFIYGHIPELVTKSRTRSDYKKISEFIKNILSQKENFNAAELGETVSVATLERFFNKYDNDVEISLNNLTKICICMDYDGFGDFLLRGGYQKQLSFLAKCRPFIEDACEQILQAYKRLPYLPRFTTLLSSTVAIRVNCDLFLLREEKKFLADGIYSRHPQKFLYKSNVEILNLEVIFESFRESWIASEETWEMFWTDASYNDVLIEKKTFKKAYLLKYNEDEFEIAELQVYGDNEK